MSEKSGAPESPYPMLIEAALHTRVWGGRQLETRLGKTLPSAQPYGESWEIFWKNRIGNGPLKGQILGDVIRARPQAMTGDATSDGEFPLLVKFLDAQDWLSVQVHPNDALAQRLEGEPRGKTECWYIIDAAPGAKLAFGLSEALNADQYRAAIAAGRAKDVMHYVEVKPGDFIFVPAGTQHAIGPGILIYELQQTSDTTYRVYDWDRMGLDGKPRELHLDKALAVTTYTVNPPAKVQYTSTTKNGYRVAELTRSQYFALDLLSITGSASLTTADTSRSRAHLLSVAKGQVTVRSAFGEPLTLPVGASAFIPARVGAFELDGAADVLHAWPLGE